MTTVLRPRLAHTQVQQQPQGMLTYQQHFQRTAAAAAVPACALLLHWVAALWMGVAQRRDMRKLQRLEATQRTMLKELKVWVCVCFCVCLTTVVGLGCILTEQACEEGHDQSCPGVWARRGGPGRAWSLLPVTPTAFRGVATTAPSSSVDACWRRHAE